MAIRRPVRAGARARYAAPSALRGLAVALFLPACAIGTRAPGQVLSRYLAAVEGGRLDEAYRLLVPTYRASHDRASFAEALARAHPPVTRLRRGAPRTHLTARALGAPGLVLEGGRWRLEADPLDSFPQRTPEDAIRSFGRAVAAGRYDVLLRFVPTRYQGFLDEATLRRRWGGPAREALARAVAAVERELGAGRGAISVTGDLAQLRLPPSGAGGPVMDLPTPPPEVSRSLAPASTEIRLVREEGTWRLESLGID